MSRQQARLHREALTLLPAGLTLAVVAAWAASGGGYESQPALGGSYEPDPWYLGALMLLGVLWATVLGLDGLRRISGWAKLAAAALCFYVLWSFASVLWADDQGAAFLGSVRALVYLASFVTFAALPWRRRSVRLALAGLVAVFGTLALVTVARLALAGDPSSLFVNARLSYPLGYSNADAAMFMTAAVVAIALSSRRAARTARRVAGLVVAAVCLQLAVLGQSRGWLFTAPPILLAALVLLPARLRLLAWTVGPVLATAAAAPSLLDVYSAATRGGVALAEPRLGQTLHHKSLHAVVVMLILDALLALAAVGASALERRRRRPDGPPSTRPRGLKLRRRTSAAATCTLAIALVASVLVATHGHPLARLESAWRSFANTSNTANGSSRFTTLGSQRVDFWRVALREFERHPLAGVGQDNFAAAYLRERHTDQEPRWTHSIELRLLTHTGLIGTTAFALFLLAVLIAALRRSTGPAEARPARLGLRPDSPGRRRASPGPRRAVAGMALLPLVVWLVHGSIDWLWEFPALSVPALAFAGAATALGRGDGPSGEPNTGRETGEHDTVPDAPAARGRGRAVVGVCVTVLCTASFVPVALAFVTARRVQSAISVWEAHPEQAYAELRAASGLMGFDTQIYLTGGAIALNLEDRPAARYWFATAASHDRQEWLAPFALGLLEGERGHLATARARLATAQALNPRESIATLALARLRRARPLTFAQAQAMFAERAQQRFGR